MNTWRTANAVVDAPLEGDVRITSEGGLELLEDLAAELTDTGFDVRRTRPTELRVRTHEGGWAR